MSELKCSFCGKSQNQVNRLIAGPGVYICDECVDLCNEIVGEEEGTGKIPTIGPQMTKHPHPLETVPPATIAAAVDSLESLIVAYDSCKRKMDAEPLNRALLCINEFLYSNDDIKLLPSLKSLAAYYEAENKLHSLAGTLSWMLAKIEKKEVEGFDKKTLLIKLARTEIELGKNKEAKETLGRLEGV